MNGSTTVIDIVAQVTDETGSGTRSAEHNISKLERSIMNLQKQILGMKGKSKLEVMATLKDMATKGIQSVAAAGKKIAGKVWTVTLKAVDLVTAPFRKVLGLLANPVTQVAAFAGVSLGVADTINTFKDFEQGMANVKAISGATNEEFAALESTAKRLGETTMFSAAQVAEAMENLAMAGWKSQDITAGMPGLLDLAAAGSVDLATAASVTSATLAQFSMSADQSTHVADVLAATATSSMTSVGGLGESLKMVGALAGSLGYSLEDTVYALGLMGNAGLDASSSGTYLSNILSRMAKQGDLTGEEANGVARAMKTLGVSLKDNTGKAKPLMAVLQDLKNGFMALGDDDVKKATIASELAGAYGSKGLLVMMEQMINAEDKANDLEQAINNATGSASEMAGIKMDTLQGSLYYLQSAAEGVKIALGEKLTPYVRGLVDWITAHMPEIQSVVGSVVDFITGKIDDVVASIHDLTASSEWKNAGTLWKKINLVWDKIIVEPFTEWWNSTGKEWLAGIAESIGKELGSTLHDGILGLLGIDTSGVTADGASIGKSFGKAFAEGFNGKEVGEAILNAIKEGLKGLVLDASTILPGGQKASGTSLLSTAILGYGGAKVLGAALGIGKTGKALFGLGKTVIGSAGAGSGLLGFGASAATRLGADTLAGGAPLSAGTLSAMGLGATAGGAVGAVSAISGGMDLFQGMTSDDEKEAAAYTQSAGWKLGGVGAGAAAGAIAGSFIPVVGTAAGGLIGAGIGGIAGMIAGDNIKNDYQKGVAAEQEAAAQSALKSQKILATTGRSLQDVKFETFRLNEALNDSQISAGEFGEMFQNAVGEKLKRRFGDIKLSMQEIQNTAEKIVFDGQKGQMETFATATEKSAASVQTLKSRMREIDRLNWEATLGVKLSDASVSEYKSAMESLVSEAQTYLTDKHYEADIAINMLVGEEGGAGIRESLNVAYEGLQAQLNDANAELQNAVSAALADGVISTIDKIPINIGGVEYELNEAEAIQKLQNKITEITNKVSIAQQDAKLEALKIRYGGAELDAESFAALQKELQASVASFTNDQNQALEVGILNARMALELNLEKDPINREQYEEEYKNQVAKLAEGYETNIENLHMRVESFQLDTIAEAFGTSLDGILPGIEGTASEKLSAAMNNALAINPEPMEWTQEQIASWFGLEGLGVETQTAISELLRQTAATIPQNMRDSILASAAETDYSGIDMTTSFCEQFLLQAEHVDLSSPAGKLMQNAKNRIDTAFGEADYSASGNAVTSGVGSAIQNADREQINSAIQALKANTDATVHSAFAKGVAAVMPIQVTADYRLTNPNFALRIKDGGSGVTTLTGSIGSNANGGFVKGAQLSWLAEEGYGEFVIPTNPSRRNRALQLYEQAGKALGITPYAEGGIAGMLKPTENNLQSSKLFPSPNYPNEPDLPDYSERGNTSQKTGAGYGNMTVPVTIEKIEINVDGSGVQDPQALVEIIKENVRGMTDEIAYQLAAAIQPVFTNMPKTAC